MESEVSDADFCIVFGNLFENAANALRTRNSCEGKGGEVVRGIGLESVAAIAEKYNGTVEYTNMDRVFTASVLMIVGD